MKTIATHLTIEGMTCDHCVRTVQKALTALPGVRTVEVRLAGGTATVVHDGAPAGSMLEALAAEGYPAIVTAQG